MASASFPEQQEEPQQVMYPEAVSNNNGSVGPFFAVMSVLAVITLLSCILGRFLARRSGNPLNIRYVDCYWWFRIKFCCCISDELELGAKAITSKPHDIETPSPPPST
ncbi:hypothetical protein IFM89_027126 [Coptis chinensis]|uniref:Transmembrane protein n=1 Tax=Coptis chinensis TaxID=261450 RepID=A0A835MG26_9MAGN|nr:hypothetical protein IFM89_027126 [Coptis chinensis]